MKMKIAIEIKSSDQQPNQYHGRFIKDDKDFAEFIIKESEIKKLKEWGFLEKTENSSDKDYYVREFEV